MRSRYGSWLVKLRERQMFLSSSMMPNRFFHSDLNPSVQRLQLQNGLLQATSMPFLSCNLFLSKRYVGPRQYAPKGLRDAAARLPVTFEFGEECNELAKVAHQTKNYGDAIDLYDRALSMRREKYGPIHEACAATLHNIGRVFLDMKEYGAAENALTEAAAIYEKVDGPESLRYAESLALLALAYVNLKFIPEAEKAFKDSIRVFRDRCFNHVENCWLPSDRTPLKEPQKHPLSAAAHALADCAQLFLMLGHEHQAIAFLEESLEIRRYLYARHVKFRPMIAQTLNKLCELKKMVNDSTGAEMCINECIDICIETMGKDHAATAQALSSKASIFAARKKFRDALHLYEESATTYAVATGKESPLFGMELVRLGRIQELCDEYEKAEKTLQMGANIIRKSMGPMSTQLAEANTFLGSLLAKQMQTDKAIELFREAVRIRKAADGKDPQLPYLYQKLGDAYASKRETHAESYFLLAVEGFRQNAEKDVTHRAYESDVLDDLGLFYIEFHHYDKAEEAFQEAFKIRSEMFTDSHPTIAYSYSNLSLLYLHKQDYENCDKYTQLSLDHYNKTPRANDLAMADVYTTRAQSYHLQKQYTEAIAAHEKALNIRRLKGDIAALSVGESLNLLARVYVSMKKYSQASNFVDEAQRIASKYNEHFTAALRGEIRTTRSQIPPIDQWSEEERAAAMPMLEQKAASMASAAINTKN